MTRVAISARTSIPIDIIEPGIAHLMDGDPHSRTEGENGARIVLLDDHREWGWRIVNYAKYRDMKSQEDRRTKWAEDKRRQRAEKEVKGMSEDKSANVHQKRRTKGPMSTDVHQCPPMSTHTDTDKDTVPTTSAVTEEDARTKLWRMAVEMLGEKARALVGKLIGKHGEKRVAQALGETAAANPADPRSYLCGLLVVDGKPKLNWSKLKSMSSPDILKMADELGVTTRGKTDNELFPALIEAYNRRTDDEQKQT